MDGRHVQGGRPRRLRLGEEPQEERRAVAAEEAAHGPAVAQQQRHQVLGSGHAAATALGEQHQRRQRLQRLHLFHGRRR